MVIIIPQYATVKYVYIVLSLYTNSYSPNTTKVDLALNYVNYESPLGQYERSLLYLLTDFYRYN